MNRTAIVARPFSYSQTRDTSRPRRRQAAALRAGLGSEMLTDLKTHAAAAQSRFPRQHGPQVRPTGIKHAFCHGGASEFRWAHVANRDEPELLDKSRRRLMQKILSAVADLGVDRLYPLAFSRPLRGRELLFAGPVERGPSDLGATGQRRQRRGAEVYANPVVGSLRRLGNLDRDIDIPAPARVLKRTSRSRS